MSPSARPWAAAMALAGLVVVLDQVTKQLAAGALDGGERVSLGLGFELADVRNRGIAFGLFGDGQGLVIAVTVAALALIVGYFALHPARRGLWLGTGLLCGGAVGNLADRLRNDEVIDFVDPPLWPAFNLADIAIVAGIVAMVVYHAGPVERDRAPRRP